MPTDPFDNNVEKILKKIIALSAALTGAVLSACVEQAPPRPVYPAPPPPAYAPPPYQSYAPDTDVYEEPPPQPVVSVYIDPPIDQPPPVQISWAPPPMLVESPPPAPFPGTFWIGGYWAWEGNWVWAHGRWAPPPRPGYNWCNPYYEHRNGAVVFVNGFWSAPGVSFVAPSSSVHIDIGIPGPGVVPGLAPIGPAGVFIPAPPGSHFGLIVPAPIGTSPAVVTSAPPIIHGGMRITTNNTTINNVTNVTNITNVTNVTVVAPASATATGQAVNASVPAQPHLAAAMHPVVNAMAPEPASAKPIPAFVPGRAPVALPPAQTVHAEVPPALAHPQQRPQSAQAPQQQPQRAQPQQPQLQQPQAPQHPFQQEQPVQPASAPHPATPSQSRKPAENQRDQFKPPANQNPVQQERHEVDRPQPQPQQDRHDPNRPQPQQPVRPTPQPAEPAAQPQHPQHPQHPPQEQARPQQKPISNQDKKSEDKKDDKKDEKKDEKKDRHDQ
jgi:hypothetical protein